MIIWFSLKFLVGVWGGCRPWYCWISLMHVMFILQCIFCLRNDKRYSNSLLILDWKYLFIDYIFTAQNNTNSISSLTKYLHVLYRTHYIPRLKRIKSKDGPQVKRYQGNTHKASKFTKIRKAHRFILMNITLCELTCTSNHLNRDKITIIFR